MVIYFAEVRTYSTYGVFSTSNLHLLTTVYVSMEGSLLPAFRMMTPLKLSQLIGWVPMTLCVRGHRIDQQANGSRRHWKIMSSQRVDGSVIVHEYWTAMVS